MYGVDGIVLSGGASTLKGLTIDRFTGYGVEVTRDGNTDRVQLHRHGHDRHPALGNNFGGIGVFSRNNVIGGTDAASRNVISGNGGNGVLSTKPEASRATTSSSGTSSGPT